MRSRIRILKHIMKRIVFVIAGVPAVAVVTAVG
jgi:hypothetical protein